MAFPPRSIPGSRPTIRLAAPETTRKLKGHPTATYELTEAEMANQRVELDRINEENARRAEDKARQKAEDDERKREEKARKLEEKDRKREERT